MQRPDAAWQTHLFQWHGNCVHIALSPDVGMFKFAKGIPKPDVHILPQWDFQRIGPCMLSWLFFCHEYGTGQS